MKLNICFFDKRWRIIWKIKVKHGKSTEKKIDSEPIYHEKYFKTKIKSYKGKTTLTFAIINCQNKVLSAFDYQ